MDVCSLRSNNKFLRYTASVISYGYLGDVMRDSEGFRWMGPRRYEFSGTKYPNTLMCFYLTIAIPGFKKFFANKGYEGELKVRLTGATGHQKDATKAPKCQIHCAECSLRFDNNDCSGKKNQLMYKAKLIFF